MNRIPLNKLDLEHTGIIESLLCTGSTRRRFLDLGLMKGTKIIPIFVSPAGDPTAFFVRGTVIALREEDSKNIIVKTMKEESRV